MPDEQKKTLLAEHGMTILYAVGLACSVFYYNVTAANKTDQLAVTMSEFRSDTRSRMERIEAKLDALQPLNERTLDAERRLERLEAREVARK